MSQDKKRKQNSRPEDEQSVERLLRSMREKAESEREEIRRNAEEERKAILENADRETERLRAESVRDVEREIEVAIAGRMGHARMEAQASRVRAKHRNLEAVFSRARETLGSISGDRYREMLTQFIREAEAFIPDGGSLHVRKDDVSIAERAVSDLGAHWKVESLDADARPGTVILTNNSGTRRVDNSFTTRLSRAETALRDDVAKVLFGAGSDIQA